MIKTSKIYIAGIGGMVGSAIKRKLNSAGFNNIVSCPSSKLDLRDQSAVNNFFELEQPELVFLAAAKVGGIVANNTYRAEFLYDNLMITANVIEAAYRHRVAKLLFLGSSCIYPKLAPQPLKEEYLLTGLLEETNEPYAIAKIAGIKLCEAYRDQYGCNFISAMPTNLYGPGDNYDLEKSHVIPALIRKIHTAKQNNAPIVEIWGSGNPLREFLHVDDLADACFYLMHNYDERQFVNVGTGEEISIRHLAELIGKIIGYTGEFVFNSDRPDGTPRKLMDISILKDRDWTASISLEEGLRSVCEAYAMQI